MPNPYPFVPSLAGTAEQPVDNLQYDDATDGTLRGRSFWTTEKERFTVAQKGLTDAERVTLKSFYADNRLLDVTLLYKSVTYTCRMLAPPRFVPSGGLWDSVVEMREV